MRYMSKSTAKGLSPYTRGNHLHGIARLFAERSIPVHTGKPIENSRHPQHQWVYPRTHGETAPPLSHLTLEEGLSPYTRGNRESYGDQCLTQGSIPVHTGKPVIAAEAANPARVYPRTHGETFHHFHPHRPLHGLSPYTRGNHPHRQGRFY